MDTFGVKGALNETFCPIIALHIESCGHIPLAENGWFAPNYRYLYHTLTKLLIKCLSELVFGVLHFFFSVWVPIGQLVSHRVLYYNTGITFAFHQ